jgi:hypothetical protein
MIKTLRRRKDRVPFITLILIFPGGGECTFFGPGAKIAGGRDFSRIISLPPPK